MTVDAITEAIGGKKDNVKKLLSVMQYQGEVERVAKGVYKLPIKIDPNTTII